MSLLARATRGVKNIDQQAQGLNPGGVYVRLDDRSTFTTSLWDAEATALSISTVYACVRVLAESVASLPLILYRRLPNGGKERATDHEMYATLHDQPNPDMTSFVWREVMMSHLATWGNAYSEKVFPDGPVGPLELWPIRPDRMEVKYGPDGGKRFTYLSPTGTRKEMRPGSVFHIPGLSSNGLVGLSPIALHRRSLRLSETALDYGTNYLNNGARPAVILSHPKNLSADAIGRLAGQMDDLRGSRNAGKTVVLEEAMTVTEVGVPPEDAQYIETRKFQRSVIASEIFRIPPHKIGDLEHATFTNIEHQSIEFVVDTLRPWLVRIEQECKAQLLYGQDVFAEFLVDGLLRGDSKARAEALQIQRNSGVINGDEWREIENLNPIEDDAGKVYWMPVNYKAAVTPADLEEPVVIPDPAEGPPQLVAVKSAAVRCTSCHRLLAEQATPPYRIACSRCKAVTEAAPGVEPESEMSVLKSMTGDLLTALTDANARPLPDWKPEIHVDARQEPPVVNVTVPPAEPTVLNVAAQEPPTVNVRVVAPKPVPMRKRVTRDERGRIIETAEEVV